MDWDHGLASARAPDYDVRATLAKLHAVCALHQSKNISSCHASTVLDGSRNLLTAPIARSGPTTQARPLAPNNVRWIGSYALNRDSTSATDAAHWVNDSASSAHSSANSESEPFTRSSAIWALATSEAGGALAFASTHATMSSQ